jgi:hypothetical protein
MLINKPNKLIKTLIFVSMKIDFKQKAVSSLLGLAFLLTQAINAQNLTISNAGETGTSGTNWSIVGNELLVSSLNSNASVHPSVIENHLLNNGDLIITLPWIDGINRNIVISNSISYVGANQRSLTFKSANAIIISSSTSISATSASLNLVFRAGMNTASTNPESGKIQFNSATISTNGGHVWIGGGQTDTTWNALQVGNTKAKTFSENESGVLISNCTIATNGGNLSINGISHVVQTISGTANQGVLIENSNINSGAGSILIDGQVNGKYKNGYGVLITSSSNNTSLNSTSGLISIQGLGQDLSLIHI